MALVSPRAFGRLLAIIVKELRATLRDPRSRMTLIVPPILQLFLFGLATTLEVKNFNVGVLDAGGGRAATEFVHRLAGSRDVGRIVRLTSPADLRAKIENETIIAAVVIDPRFDRDVAAGRPATLGVILDGRRSNAAQIVAGYIGVIAQTVGLETRLGPPTGAPAAAPVMGSVVRNAFNPNLDYVWFTLPSLIMMVGAVSALTVTAQSVARERELGTYEQLLVSPLRTHEILIGKMVPPLIAGLFNGTVYLLVAQIVFGVPFSGSLALFYLTLVIYLLSLMGVGMLVSTLAATQQQAFLGVFLVTVPSVMLSGYAGPVDNMPPWLQTLSLADPCRHYLVIVDGLFLKAMPWDALWPSVWPLLVIGAVTLSAASWLFRARKE
jgi:ABC-2 type transport system permease protein